MWSLPSRSLACGKREACLQICSIPDIVIGVIWQRYQQCDLKWQRKGEVHLRLRTKTSFVVGVPFELGLEEGKDFLIPLRIH